jgi:amino acid permease
MGIVEKADIRSVATIALISIFGGVFVGVVLVGDHTSLAFTQSMWEQMFSLFIGLIIGVFAWLGIKQGQPATNP